MLDKTFNAKFGDFSLTRLSEHGSSLKMTCTVRNVGYIAPECFTTRKGSKESDVYSFGIVALEIACGRRCIQNNGEEEEDKSRSLLDWVWIMHEKGKLLEAIDSRLLANDGHSHEEEILNLMMVGLWCAYPDAPRRLSMSQAIAFLNQESPQTELP